MLADSRLQDERDQSSPPLTGRRGPVADRAAATWDISGAKGSVFYRAHSYHTKVPVEGLVGLLEHYTDPGDLVVDPFCGSGMTGLAAVLTGRRAAISDLSPAAVHISSGYTRPVDPSLLEITADKVLHQLADIEERLYGDRAGRVEYTVWSDVFGCPECGVDIPFWNAAVDIDAGTVATAVCCAEGHGPFTKKAMRWRRSVPVQENISSGKKSRLVRPIVLPEKHPRRVERSDIGAWYPQSEWSSGREMWRGQHRDMGIGTAADFFTDRNLFALAELWERINQVEDDPTRLALRFVFTATVNRASRRYQWHPSRPTNVLSSTMYVASLNYEFNVFSLFRRKLSTAIELHRRLATAQGSCEVRQGSATDLSWLPDESVDYVFTDPPFGSNIFYGDSSFLWETWLGTATDLEAEAVVNRSRPRAAGGKGIAEYEALMSAAMTEIARVLRPNASMSLQFHNSDDAVWSSIQRVLEVAGFEVEVAVLMDKSQASFKGLRHESKGEKVANFDIVMHARRGAARRSPRRPAAKDDLVAVLREHVRTAPPSKRTTPWLHSVAMRWMLAQDSDFGGWSFAAIEELATHVFEPQGKGWALKTGEHAP